MIKVSRPKFIIAAILFGLSLVASVSAQDGRQRGPAKPMTVPVTIRLRDSKPVEMRIVDYLLREDGEMQTILSQRTPKESPLTLAILFQDDLVSSVSSEARTIAEFIRNQPGGSRVMIAYIRQGSLDVRRKFTNELERVAQGVRAPLSLASASPFNPYVEIIEGLRRFDSQPLGRRAMIVISDGLDVSRGVDSSSPGQSLDLQRAITEAQRRSVAVYSIFVPSLVSAGQNLNLNGQSCLERLSSETGGRAFFQGTGAPVSFDPFLKEINTLFEKQIALTYLSTHTKKGFHKLDIKPLERDVEIRHPAGYTR
jgi:VWFA-related protein